jgi:hypothetical protein
MIDSMTLVAFVCIGLVFTGFALTYREFRDMSGRRYARAASPARAQAGRARHLR